MTFRREILAEGVTTIYGLCEPDGRVRYVGKTIGTPERRLTYHLAHAKKGSTLPSARWLRKKQAAGIRPTILVLETVGADWAEREQHWIAFYRSTTPDLLNITDGGEGTPGRIPTPEHKAKIAEANRTGLHFHCEVCSKQFWRKQRDIKRGDTRFCSRDCYGVWQRGRKRPVSDQFTRAGIAAAAIEKRSRTHCKRGHPLSGDNLFITHGGSRGCKECRKLHKLTYRGRINAVA